MPQRRRRRPQRGGAKWTERAADIAKAVHKAVRDEALLSRALQSAGYNTAGDVAAAVGYGRRRGMQGAGFGDFFKSAVSLPLYAAGGLTGGLLQGVSGFGRMRGGARRPAATLF